MKPDYGPTAADYSRFRAQFPSELYARLGRIGVGLPGQRLLDLGTGTGVLARAFAEQGCVVTGLDPARALLSEAERAGSESMTSVQYVRGVAEKTGFADQSFDIVTAGVCWHWFDADRAAREIRRILVPGGRLVIVHFDWLSIGNDLVALTERLMNRHSRRRVRDRVSRLAGIGLGRLSPSWAGIQGTGIHPDRLTTLWATGFRDIESFSFDASVPYNHEAWRGRIRSHADVGATLDPSRVRALDAELEQLLSEQFPEDILEVPHRVFVVIGSAV